MVVALAGRRTDESGLRKRIEELLLERNASAVVCSAACGADLIALEAAGCLGLRRLVVLPYEREVFRQKSVTDRGGDWGGRYDDVLDEVQATGDLMILDSGKCDADAYLATNLAILREAERLAREQDRSLLAVVVWEGLSRGDDDVTEHFRASAKDRGLAIAEVATHGGALSPDARQRG